MAHYVICSVCGKKFNRDVVQAVKTGARRYAHIECCPDGEKVPLPQRDPDLIKLENYIQKLLGDDYNKARVNKQIKQFIEEYNYSYSGILKSLVYFFEVKGNSTDKANGGIGIVPFVYKDAYNYYYSLFVAQQQNTTKDVVNITSKIKEITIPVPKIILPKRFFNLDDDEVDNE